MQIQFNTDKNVIMDEEQIASSTFLISEDLSRFSTQITRLKVHLSDEDGNKDGFTIKHCMVEARLAGMKPIAATDHANTHVLAILGAIDKLKASLETISGHIKSY
ncbi:MAG: ribosomal subunit interface protein [Bacteroidetes bacterium GWE2_42_24]|nr:MAG: ribosomal subunit interface protein [Bacteroidetes bacterium GWE2_42_24]OFY27116.1 MAG: ribosomal subunit interface protein [Bacteroidetes bacterium GWF2_43_11]HCU20667.1 hypothetical protein [Bacteroidales bacterium]